MISTEAGAATVRRFYELLKTQDIDGWGELWHPSARLVVLYPAEGFPSVIEGKDSIVAGFRDLIGIYESYESELTRLYPAADSDAVCVEYSVRAQLVGGDEYTNENIAVFLFDDDLIREYRDYFDPRRFQMVVDALSSATNG
jgi:ketosteroid isomerase-like protein